MRLWPEYALENDRKLMDPRSKYITQYYIRPILRQVPPRNTETSFSVGADDTSMPGQTTVEMPGTPEVTLKCRTLVTSPRVPLPRDA